MNPDDTLRASEEVEVEGEEAIGARGVPSPTQPTRKEIQEHVLSHLPPRSWCGHCLRGRRTSLPHFRSKTEGDHVVPTASIDYLAVKSHESRMTFAHVVERKGPVDSTVRRLVADLDWLGLRRLVFKSDQELAILALKQAVRESMPTVEFVMEESPVEELSQTAPLKSVVKVRWKRE